MSTAKRNGFCVIIVTYNSAQEIGDCLESLFAQELALQILIVDNASSDESQVVITDFMEKDPRIQMLESPENSGFSKACNRALELVTSPFVLFLNPDAALFPDALERVAEGFQAHPEAGVLGLRVYDWDGRTLQLSCRSFPGFSTVLFHRYSLLTRLFPGNPGSRRYLKTQFDHEESATFDWVSGCALAARTDLLQDLGGFDEQFFLFSEDVDLCQRVWSAGKEVRYWPPARARHRIGSSSQFQPAAAVRARHDSMWLYYKKHLRGGRLLDGLTYLGIRFRCWWTLLRIRLQSA